MISKILLKDLPFDSLKKDTVISIYNHNFIIDRGKTWYNGSVYMGSDNGHSVISPQGCELIKVIWDNTEWFESVGFTPIKYSRTNKSITLSFEKPVALSDIETVAIGIQRTLEGHYKDTVGYMGWIDEKADIKF